MNLQALPQILNDAYAMFDSLQLSVTSLVVAGLVLTLFFLFALREAATWFFKINDMKADLRRLRQLVVDMEGELRLMHSMLAQNLKIASEEGIVDMEMRAPSKEGAATSVSPAPTKFPVTH